MDHHRNLGVCEYLERLAAENDRSNTMATVRGHDDEIAAFRFRCIDDRLVGMLMLDLDRLARDACFLRCVHDGAKSFHGMLLHPRFVFVPRVLDHLRVGRERMKGRQDRQCGSFGVA